MKLKIKVTEEVLRKTAECGLELAKLVHSTVDEVEKHRLQETYGHLMRTNCAVAYAVRLIAPRADVNGVVIAWEPDDMYVSSLPDEARLFIKDFDECGSPEARLQLDPFEFEVDYPDELVERIGITQLTKILANSNTLEMV